MWQYIARRLTYMAFTIWVISIVAFVVIQLPPGDFVTTLSTRLASAGGGASVALLEQQLREQYGLNEPVYIQYFKWLGNILLHGKFGYSFTYQIDASQIIGERLPMTFLISFLAVLFIWVVALPIGIFSAVKKYTWGDYTATFIGFIGLAVPNFLLALIIMYIASHYFGRSAFGLFSPEYATAPWSWGKVGDLIQHLWLPVAIIGSGGAAGLIRTMRANLLDELNKPYVETVRAKGVAERKLLIKYPVRYALNPFVSTIGWVLPGLVAGEVIVSQVLNLPTSGPILISALLNEDMYLAAGFILVLSSLTVIGTFISDILLIWLDPRIRLMKTG